MIMLTKRITATLFAIAIASSLIIASGFVSNALATKKGKASETNMTVDPNGTDQSSPQKLQSNSAGGSNGDMQDRTGTSAKDLKSLAKCQADAAKQGDLTLADIDNCYGQVFNQGGQGHGTDQSSSAQSNDQSNGGPQSGSGITSSSLQGQKIGTMGEGFPF